MGARPHALKRAGVSRIPGYGGTMPRWLILLIAVLVVLVIAILVAEHVHVGVH